MTSFSHLRPSIRFGKARKQMQRPEQDLSIAVVNYLRTTCPEAFVFHTPNEGQRSRFAGHKLKQAGMVSGVSDLCLLWEPGRCGFIELKAPGRESTLTDKQEAFIARMQAIGIPVSVASSVAEVSKIVASWGIPSRDNALRSLQ